MDKNDINMEELNKMVSKGAILLDVRSPQEYREGHLKGAISIPEYELANRCSKELKNKDQEIIVYCSSGSRSKKAQKQLQRKGYIKVYNLYNGIQNYWDFKINMLELGTGQKHFIIYQSKSRDMSKYNKI